MPSPFFPSSSPPRGRSAVVVSRRFPSSRRTALSLLSLLIRSCRFSASPSPLAFPARRSNVPPRSSSSSFCCCCWSILLVVVVVVVAFTKTPPPFTPMGVCFPSSSPPTSRAKTTTTTKTGRKKKKKRKKKREERGKKEHALRFLLLLLLLLRAFSSSFPPLDAIFGRLFPFSSNFKLSKPLLYLGFLIFSLRRRRCECY